MFKSQLQTIKNLLSVFLHQKLKKHITLVLKLKDMVKNHFRIEMQNNAVIVKFFLLKARKKWKKIYWFVQEKLELIMYSTMEKYSVTKTITTD